MVFVWQVQHFGMHANSFVWQTLGFGSMMVVLRGPAMQLTCNTHATHSQHNTQHEHFSCKFSIKVRDFVGLTKNLVICI